MEAPSTDPEAARHEALVSALIDQLAAGQVETLYGLHSAAAALRRETEALRAAAEHPLAAVQAATAAVVDVQGALTTSSTSLHAGRAALETVAGRLLDEIADQVTRRVVNQVHDQLAEVASAQAAVAAARVAEATAAFEAAAAAASERVDAATARFVDATRASQHQLEAAAAATFEAAAAAASERVDAATMRLVDATQASQHQLEAAATAATGALERQAAAATEEIASASDALERAAGALQHAVAGAVDLVRDVLDHGVGEIQRVSGDAVAGIDHVGGELLEGLRSRTESFFNDLKYDLSRREARDASRERALVARVKQLAEQSEGMVAAVTSRLAEETDRLIRRDVEQEAARAQAFADVLETLLTRVGGRRQLRKRVQDAVHQPPAVLLEPAPAEAPVLPAPTTAPPAKKAPAKRAAAAPKKATQRKKAAE